MMTLDDRAVRTEPVSKKFSVFMYKHRLKNDGFMKNIRCRFYTYQLISNKLDAIEVMVVLHYY